MGDGLAAAAAGTRACVAGVVPEGHWDDPTAAAARAPSGRASAGPEPFGPRLGGVETSAYVLSVTQSRAGSYW
ncbi:hypothetical protein [Fodinicola feengrottensis]|uniref:hypothetical protein n=1 Tax=Fodinicola feengrottensis TaxID=435914 RepID=UPI0031E36DE9